MSEIRFATSADGTRIAYTTFGSGPPLVEVPRWAQTIEWNSRDEEFARFYEKLGEFRRVTIVERRGTGASERDVDDFSMQAHIADVLAVADAAGLESFDIFGSGDAAAVCICLAARMPERVQRLLLWGAYASPPGVFGSETMPGSGRLLPSPTLTSVANYSDMFRTNWPLAARLVADAFFPNSPADHARRIAGFWTEWLTKDAAYEYVLFSWGINILDQLAAVQAPALVMHRRGHQTGHSLEACTEVAARIANTRFVIVDGDVGVHQYQHDQIIAEMRKFLGDEAKEPAQPPVAVPFRAVLFTDLVGHTEMMSRLGDERGRTVLREHERIAREALKAHGGTEIKTTGDGFMASFGSVTRAVECAIALQRAFAEREGEPLSVRVGLNAGEPIEEDGDLFGATVILASRIAAKAERGEILVADTCAGYAAARGFSLLTVASSWPRGSRSR